MRPSTPNSGKTTPSPKAPFPLWLSIILLIILVCLVVGLFGVIIFLFIRGAQQLGLSPLAQLTIFVVISGIFAWLVKRLTDIVSSMSHLWFPEESNEEN